MLRYRMGFGVTPPDAPAPASGDEVAAWVGLSRLPGVGPRTIAGWVDRAGSARAVWQHLPAFIQKRAERAEILAAWRKVDPAAILEGARSLGLTVLAVCDPGFPALLRAIPDPPPVLYVRGSLDEAASVAVVGSRRATPYGLAAAERLAFDLAQEGITIVSGLARGIDSAAHKAALDGGGRTVAVLGCGADVTYPPEHRRLALAVAARGALVSEFPPGTPPLPGHFPRRNRLISGLALGVVVVEGAGDSGALVTVDYALDQGREVFAVPGSIFSPRSAAPHRLLRQGACMVESAGDILTELGLGSSVRSGPGEPCDVAVPSAGAEGAARLLALLEGGPLRLDELAEQASLSAAAVGALVTMLEMRGLIRTLPGQMVMRNPAGRGRGG
ncbi:MAG: DNA-processing protein DprA [bacterium]|nr:DNA-processing protein DprA [bacterium]